MVDTRTTTPEDLTAIRRIWREVGWADSDEEAEPIEDFLAEADARVVEVDGAAEASGSVHRGTLDHTGTLLDAAVVTSITTSRVGRKQGFARAVLDDLLVDAAADGAAIAVLGMFEQGFYDRSGFGTGAEDIIHRLDPASLSSTLPYRQPIRLTVDHAPAMAAALVARATGHGGVRLPSATLRRAEMAWAEHGHGLGYRDATGALTHFVWCSTKGEHGPVRVDAWAWQDDEQLRELLGLLRAQGDQVRSLVVIEPWRLQLQTLTSHPGRQRLLTTGSDHEYVVRANAWWQARMLDLRTCVAALRAARPLDLTMTVTDPLAGRLPGVAGDWTVALHPDGSIAERRDDGRAAQLTCSVNTLTRLWLGVRSPSAVLATDGVGVAPDLVDALDQAIVLPRPDVGIDF